MKLKSILNINTNITRENLKKEFSEDFSLLSYPSCFSCHQSDYGHTKKEDLVNTTPLETLIKYKASYSYPNSLNGHLQGLILPEKDQLQDIDYKKTQGVRKEGQYVFKCMVNNHRDLQVKNQSTLEDVITNLGRTDKYGMKEIYTFISKHIGDPEWIKLFNSGNSWLRIKIKVIKYMFVQNFTAINRDELNKFLSENPDRKKELLDYIKLMKREGVVRPKSPIEKELRMAGLL